MPTDQPTRAERLTRQEAVALFPGCEAWQIDGVIGECAFRTRTRATFGYDTSTTLSMMAAEVYRVLAQAYMRGLDETY